MIYKLEIPINGDFYMDEPQADLDGEFMEPVQEQYFPGSVPLSSAELAEYEQEIQDALHDARTAEQLEDNTGLFSKFPEGELKHRIHYADVSVRTAECCLQGELSISVKDQLSEEEKDILNRYIWQRFQSSQYTEKAIPVPGGEVRICFETPDPCELAGEKKYKITDRQHPRYPWLHRICSLVRVNEHVPPETLGGFIQKEENLSQEGECWVYDDAICCEDAAVEKNAGLFDGAMARGAAMVTGDAQLFDRAVAEGRCYIRNGEVKEDARVAGDAVLAEGAIEGLSPLVAGHSNIYGEVRGWFVVKDNVLPGQELINPTEDLFILENGRMEVLVKERKLEPPQEYDRSKAVEKPAAQKKKKKQPER